MWSGEPGEARSDPGSRSGGSHPLVTIDFKSELVTTSGWYVEPKLLHSLALALSLSWTLCFSISISVFHFRSQSEASYHLLSSSIFPASYSSHEYFSHHLLPRFLRSSNCLTLRMFSTTMRSSLKIVLYWYARTSSWNPSKLSSLSDFVSEKYIFFLVTI